MQSDPAIEIPDVQAPVRQSAMTERNSVSTLDREVHGRPSVVDSSWKRRFFTLDGSPICLYCKRAGHVRRDCRKRLRDFGPPPDSNDRCPPTPIHRIFTTVGCRERRPRGCRGAGRSRRPDFVQGGSVSVRESSRAFGPIQRPVKVPVLEPTPGLDYLCTQMRNLSDPALFPGSVNAIIAVSAVEQPEEVTMMIQDGGMISCDAETIDANQETMVEDVVNVPNLFSENGTSDNNVMSLDDDQRSISTVGDDYCIDYMATGLARVRPRRGSPIFTTGMTVLSSILTVVFCFSLLSAGFSLTEGQIFVTGSNSVPRFRPVSRGPSYEEVLYLCPTPSGGFKPRQTNGRRPHLWCDVNHAFCNERQTNGRRPHQWRDTNHALWCGRQTIRLVSIIEKGHDRLLFSRLAWGADGRPMSAEPLRDSWSISWCPERCGIRLLFREGEQSEAKRLFHFRQSPRRLSAVNRTPSGDTTQYQPNSDAFTHGDQRSEMER
ncbi:MAG: hypothetical protein GY696_23750, partial [Gammaproteobacteria bacterium]|nr:hypothetical protein [Gammaproteobacteria bacterium]